jgi:DNA gyrase subunit B
LTLFFRQLPKLVEGGHVYIAQPPLYKIKRGQREEYIQTEEQMNDLLLDLGTEGTKLTSVKPKQEYTDKQFKELLGLLVELGKLKSIIEKRGVNFKKFLALRHPKTKKLPIYIVKVDEKPQFVYSDAELSKITGVKNKKDEKLTEDSDIVELFEVNDIESVIQKIEKMGPDIELYLPLDLEMRSKKELKKSLYKIKGEKETVECDSLIEVLESVKTQAQKGMHIQRYKGLGEMNPQQLWDTTMDPAKRTVLQVTLEDAVEAEETFTTLMGSEVEPRREFIESQAHTVKNLDI